MTKASVEEMAIYPGGICPACGTKKCGSWHFKVGNKYIPAQTKDDEFLRKMDKHLGRLSKIETDRDEFLHKNCTYQAKLLRNAFREGYIAAASDIRKLVKVRKIARETELSQQRDDWLLVTGKGRN